MILVSLFLSFAKIGLLGFGGGLTIIALIFDTIQPFTSISIEDFSSMVAIAQATPGPVAVNMATYVGYDAAGIMGAIAATFGVALPAFVIVSVICKFLANYASNPYVKGMIAGIKPASVGMMTSAFVTISSGAFLGQSYLGIDRLGKMFPAIVEFISNLPIDPISVLICIATIVLIGYYKKNPFFILIIMGCIGALLGI